MKLSYDLKNTKMDRMIPVQSKSVLPVRRLVRDNIPWHTKGRTDAQTFVQFLSRYVYVKVGLEAFVEKFSLEQFYSLAQWRRQKNKRFRNLINVLKNTKTWPITQIFNNFAKRKNYRTICKMNFLIRASR